MKVLALLVLSFLFISNLSNVRSVSADSDEIALVPHLENLVILDNNGVDWTHKTLMAGGEYVVTFSVLVEVGQPDNEVLLTTSLLKTGDWYRTINNIDDSAPIENVRITAIKMEKPEI